MANGLPSFVTAQPFSSTPVVGDNFGDGGGGDEPPKKTELTPKQNTAEAEIGKLEAQRELARVEKAQSEGKAAAEKARQSAIYEEYKPQLTQKFEPFQAPKESFSSLAGIGMMLMAVGSMGGKKGLTSATGAMNAIAGMATGYQQGRKEEFDRQKQIFEENYKIMKENQAQIEKEFQYALKYAKTDLTGATNKLIQSRTAAGDAATVESLKKNGLVPTITQQTQAARSGISKVEEAKNKVFEAEKGVIRAKAAEATPAEAREKSVADFIFKNKAIPKTAEEMAAVQKYYPDYKIEGGPPTKGSAQAIQAGQRMINATAGAASGFEAVSGIKGGTTTGILPFINSKEGITNFLKSAAGRQLATDDAKILDVYYTGIARNLAAIESSGAATGLVGLTKSFENLKPAVGDSNYVVAAKLADARRIVAETMKAVADSGTLTSDQKKTTDQLVKRIETAIPFTIDDVNKAVTKGKPNIGKVTSESVQGKPTADQFLEKARVANPNATDEQLLEFYKKKYGGQ